MVVGGGFLEEPMVKLLIWHFMGVKNFLIEAFDIEHSCIDEGLQNAKEYLPESLLSKLKAFKLNIFDLSETSEHLQRTGDKCIRCTLTTAATNMTFLVALLVEAIMNGEYNLLVSRIYICVYYITNLCVSLCYVFTPESSLLVIDKNSNVSLLYSYLKEHSTFWRVSSVESELKERGILGLYCTSFLVSVSDDVDPAHKLKESDFQRDLYSVDIPKLIKWLDEDVNIQTDTYSANLKADSRNKVLVSLYICNTVMLLYRYVKISFLT